MAKKPSITTISSGYQTTDTINTNFTNVMNAFDNTLSRDGSTPNSMAADFDMDGNDILNVGNIYVDNIIYEGALPILNGGTGATTASGARDNLGLGTAATKNTSYFTLANYTASGTGAVSRPVTDKLAETISVLDYGAVGDGVADDTNAINAAATAASGKRLFIPAGRYRVKAINIFSRTTVEADVDAVFVPSDTTDKTSANYCIRLNGDNINWSGGKVLGQIYTAYGDDPSPYYCFVINKTTGDQHATNVLVENLRVVGGQNGIWAVSTDECTVQNCFVSYSYRWGLSFPAPRTKRLIVHNVRVSDTGINEGLKISSLYQQTGDQTSDVILSNLDIHNCGNLNTASRQNAIDLFISSATRLSINNFNIYNPGAAGIELKRNDAPNISPNTYREIRIQNGTITALNDSSGGISLNVTSPYPSTSAGTGGVMISNVQFNYDGPSNPVSANGITMSAWNDVMISNCQFYGNFKSYINPSASASLTDTTIGNLVIQGCVGYGGITGLFTGNLLSNARFVNNLFETTGVPIVFASGTTANNVLVQGGYYKNISGSYAIQCGGTVNNLIVEYAQLIGGTYGILTNGAATIRRNEITANTNTAIRVNSGACVAYENTFNLLSTQKSYLIIGGSMTSYRNTRGYSSTAPTTAAEVGDIVYNSVPTSGGYTGWICTTGGTSGSAVWKAFGAIL